jgi:hypothetical protein
VVLATETIAAGASSTVVVVQADDISPNGPWASPSGSDTGTLDFVAGPAEPPLGSGSLRMAVANSSEHRAFYDYEYGTCATGPSCTDPGTPLADVTKLEYSTYRDAASTQPGVVPSFNIEVDPDSTTGSGVNYTTLIWEPAGNGGGVLNNTWQTWNPFAGNWYSTANLTGYGVLECPAFTCTATWTQIVTALPDSIIRFGIGPNAGSGWSSFSGNVDRFVVGVNDDDKLFDFERPPAVSVGDASVFEGDAGKRIMRLMVHLDIPAPADGVTVTWATLGGSATPGVDFKSRSGQLYFKYGQTTRFVKIVVNPDATTEGNETFSVWLTGVTGATVADPAGVATIVDAESVSGTAIAIGDATVREGQNGGSRYVNLTVTLNQPSASTVTVSYSTANGSAVSPNDYLGRSGTITFRPKARHRYVLVYLTPDQLVEGNQSFSVNLSSPVNATIADGTGTVTLVDDD